MYKITIKLFSMDTAQEISYATRESAMDAWDQFVDDALYGDELTLVHPKGSILSQYAPVYREEDHV